MIVMTSSLITPGTYNIDASHSRVGFAVRHLMISKVRGNFGKFDGAIVIAPDLSQSSVNATVEMASVNTGDEGRDGHLRNSDFFDTDVYPTMTFASTGLLVNGTEGVLNGNLTLHGVTKPVSFDVEFEGAATDPWGNKKIAFAAKTEINRKDFGVEWNAVLEAGGVAVSEKVTIELDIQAVTAS
jgi:polyisoprenoid-binding protein YceI